MDLNTESHELQSELDAVLADYMRRIDQGELVDREAFIKAHPELANELRSYFSTASAADKLADGTVDMERDFTDRKHSATMAYSPSDGDSASTKPRDDSPRVTQAGERFRILRSYALGGLGEVSLAHDEQLNRIVALKELQDRFSTDTAKKSRFLLEGEVTGSLEHPGIVPVYAMGQDDDGRPFYAMRFIRGESLREAIRNFHKRDADGKGFSRNSLEFRQLLSRVVDVCNAVAFAHDRGVLHRDIKPENVMLGDFGEALLVDWGMARVIGQPVPDTTIERELRPSGPKHFSATREGSALGTPAYMSPEVAAGKLDQLGPPCDIFSLGASLYCVLTNNPPLQANSLTELLNKAERCDFPTAIEVNPRVPKVLNAICCKAMALQQTDRYASALELAADIERWLADESVSAYEEPLPERAFRWLRRHRSWALSGAAAICVVTLVSTIAAVWINGLRRQAEVLATREAAAHKEAVAKYAQSRDTVNKWLRGFARDIEYYPGVETFREQMLLQAAEDYRRFSEQVSDDPELELERGRTLVLLGDVRSLANQKTAAEDAYQQAAKVFAGLTVRGVSPALSKLEIANVWVRQGIMSFDSNKFEDAKQSYDRALEDLQSISPNDVDSQRLTTSLVDAHNFYSKLSLELGELDHAERHSQRAIELQTGIVRAKPADLSLVGQLADARLGLGKVVLVRGNAKEAASQFQQSIKHWDQMVVLEPENPEPLESRAEVLVNLATGCWRELGLYGRESEAYRNAIADYNALRKTMPDAPRHRENLAVTENDLGQLLVEIGRPRDAADLLTKTCAEFQMLMETFPLMIRYRQELASCLDNLGQAQLELGLHKDGLDSHEKAESLFAGLTKEFPDVPDYQDGQAIARSHVGEAQAALGNADEGIDSLQASIAQLSQPRSSSENIVFTMSALASAIGKLGDIYYGKGDLPKAREAYSQAAQKWLDVINLKPLADYLNRAGSFLAMCPADAVPIESPALDYAQRAADAAPENGHYLGTLGMAQYRAGRAADAIALLDRASKLESYDRGRDELVRALCQSKLGQTENAQKTLEQATAWIAGNRPGNATLQRLLAVANRAIASKGGAQTGKEISGK